MKRTPIFENRYRRPYSNIEKPFYVIVDLDELSIVCDDSGPSLWKTRTASKQFALISTNRYKIIKID